jgi:ureidoglycolate dehydrogenase (NAD+)
VYSLYNVKVNAQTSCGRVSDMSDVRINHEPLKLFVAEVFEKAGLPPDEASTEAEVLVWANLRGIASHGVLRIPSYLDSIEAGLMNTRPNIQIIKETPAVLFVDADRAMGPVVTTYVMGRVIEKARSVGIGWGLLRKNTHQGAMGYYSEMAALEGLAGIAIVCSPPNMAPFGAKAAGLHNSPIAISVPAGRRPPVTLDMATSVAAGGKLTLASDKGIPLGDDWALDQDGNPTTDPEAAKILVPAGGPKGSGLAFMFQCLTSLMAGNPLLAPVLAGAKKAHSQNSVVAAVDISLFTDLEDYGESVDTLVDCLSTLPCADGHSEILYPGEPELRTARDREANGIPLPRGTVQKLRDTASRLNLELPNGL